MRIAACRLLPVAVALTLGAFAASTAHARDAAVAEATPNALLVQLDLGRSGLDAETVRQAIESELGVPVRLVDTAEEATLAVSADGRRRATAVAKSKGDRVERKIDLPADGTQATESIAWLAGNLARDEAAELIASLRVEPEPPPAEPTEEAKSEPEPPPPPLPPKPKPEPKAATKTAASRPTDVDAGTTEDNRFPLDPRRPVNFTLAHPLALFPSVDERTVRLELGLVYSLVGGIRGFGFNPGVIRVRGPVRGVVASLGFTQSGPVEGAALAMGATSIERVRGVEIGVGAAIVEHGVEGAQLAVGGNVAGGNVEGAQLAAGGNVAGGNVEGAQLAAGANIARGTSQGVQATVGVNLSAGSLRGIQVSSVNVARELRGAQVGVINVGKSVHGVQLGLINVADELDGISLGLVNIARNTRVQGVAWAGSEEYANVGVKIVTGYIYTALGGGYRFDSKLAASDVGIGPHFEIGPMFVEPGIHHSQGYGQEAADGEDGGRWSDFIYRAALGLDLGGFGIFGGAGLRHSLEASDPDVSPTFFGGITLFGARPKPARTASR